jgi:hypothetical protein
MYQLLSDNPESNDRLGFQPMADILVDVIEHTPSPFTIGIFGAWGSGKTTLMSLIRQGLEAGTAKTVWFNAWKYDGKEVIWNALIQTIFLAMKENEPAGASKSFLERVEDVAGKLAIFAAKKATTFIPGDLVKPEDVDAVVEAFRPLSANDKQFSFINRFEQTFDELVKDYVGVDGRLVVFVDDLDRCLPENAIQVLEAIKLYLDRTNVTFVIGAERAVIEQGIRERYKDNPRLSAKEYLEKIVQLPFVMRSLSETGALSLMAPYAEALGYGAPAEGGESGNRPAAVAPADQRIDPDKRERTMRHIVFAGTESNPRRIKRFINSYYVLARMSERAGRAVGSDAQQLAVVLMIQMRFPEIYDALEREPGLIKIFHDALGSSVDQREDTFQKRKILREIFDDVPTRRFFESIRSIDCSKEALEPWLLLSKGIDPSTRPDPNGSTRGAGEGRLDG